jgi:hypothetical protein
MLSSSSIWTFELLEQGGKPKEPIMLHDFPREVQLTEGEWSAGIQFLTEVALNRPWYGGTMRLFPPSIDVIS